MGLDPSPELVAVTLGEERGGERDRERERERGGEK